ncbi:hypothetical protein AS159_03860 [Thermotoga sp. Ku-13t]|uniref:hypothetical protein n=1 Tax=Thermotoga sp. Ku-13t TaxID=1755813 RepID=UPI0013EB69B2|nr:hypothetical protein [Thermotoga sp. Ku-13t]KAF2958819.1 hypothetical protein AS159_03860 [Thermotoga sp. Ku-13t]
MKYLVILSVLVGTLLLGVTQFIPATYDFVLLATDNAKHYDQLKKIPLFDTFINGLGIEPMVQGMVASQLVKYGVKMDQFNELLSNQVLVVQRGENFFGALGPAKETEKLVKAISDLLGKDVWVGAQKSYVFFSNNKDFAGECLKGGGSIAADIMKYFDDATVWAVGYSPRLVQGEAEFESVLVVRVEPDRMSGSFKWKAKNDAAKKIIAEATPDRSYRLHEDPNLSGEIFVFSNVQSVRAVKAVLEQMSSNLADSVFNSVGQIFGISAEPKNVVQEILALSEKVSGKMAASIGVGQFLQSLFETQSATVTVEPSFYAVVEARTTPSEIAKILGRGEVSGEELKIDNLIIRCEGNYVKIFSQAKGEKGISLEKALKFFDPVKHSLFVFIDFAPIVEKLLGVSSQSVFVAVGTITDSSYTTDWYIK